MLILCPVLYILGSDTNCALTITPPDQNHGVIDLMAKFQQARSCYCKLGSTSCGYVIMLWHANPIHVQQICHLIESVKTGAVFSSSVGRLNLESRSGLIITPVKAFVLDMSLMYNATMLVSTSVTPG